MMRILTDVELDAVAAGCTPVYTPPASEFSIVGIGTIADPGTGICLGNSTGLHRGSVETVWNFNGEISIDGNVGVDRAACVQI
jgi:hypothetical protein